MHNDAQPGLPAGGVRGEEVQQGGDQVRRGGGDIASAIANCICVIHKSFNCTNNNVQLCILAVNIFKLQFGSYKRYTFKNKMFRCIHNKNKQNRSTFTKRQMDVYTIHWTGRLGHRPGVQRST